MLVNVDGYGEARGNCVPLNNAVYSTYHIVLSVPFSFPRALSLSPSILIPLTRSLSRLVVLSLSLFFSLSLLRAVVGLSESLFLSLCLSLYFCLTCSLSFSLDDRTSDSLILSPTHPPHSLFLSLLRDCDGPQHSTQLRVISISILMDSELGLVFVATLWYNMRFLQGSASFPLAFCQP